MQQRLPRIVELLLFIALCAVIALWATRALHGTPIAVPPTATDADPGANGRVDAVLASARLFGSRRPGVLSDNVRALGVVADASGRGSVIISVDGQPPKVYRVGDTLDGRLVSAIRPQEIELESGGARQVFRLPLPQPTASGLTILGTGPAPGSEVAPARPESAPSTGAAGEIQPPTFFPQSRRGMPQRPPVDDSGRATPPNVGR